MPPPADTRIGVKICGLTEPAGLEAAVTHGADWIGFVFFARSPRHVTPAQAASLIARVPQAGPRRIGLFVEPTDAQITAALDAAALDGLQVYAAEERALEIRRHFGLPVWHARGVATAPDLPSRSPLDGLVIESRPPAGSDRPGGNAHPIDWTITRGWTAPVPWMLAGGLAPDTVARAIAQSGARAVDVSSGVESAPGLKDPGLIARFIRAARGGHNQDGDYQPR
ncbi:Phosphoribosylanthranilate isomerase [Gluconacetobacter diazotrophicus PA1 5]|uniref:N-(5'-phosphoribosyl)anthranilate isomerase n=1 Tax=Gluconacetobacter diazotrophicus TaxID=33996 RepID=A0A7W4FDD8_GLUDI|nr:phosphoribosylanthranilate isomerase [Gluconacetobacter diazotrophicus]ACI51795.1 Phosphoribosylanthranilate isomerase [Gluconacetobacter diazotrophicus PA1 5]MBB2155649.1 phosphoribosylanthranilate isomerase [Gluconacetobacter diazotrophicus]